VLNKDKGVYRGSSPIDDIAVGNWMLTVQINNSGTVCSGSAEDLGALRAQFAAQHYLKLPGLLAPGLLDFLQSKVQHAEFYERVHDGIGPNSELCMKSNTAAAALLFLMNDKKLFQIIQDVTQCDPIGCFEGRVYRVNPGRGHHDSWHDDVGEHRLVGMSINLSRRAYSGGTLQMRDRISGEIVSEVPNAGIGDAVIFRLSDRLQHRITDVEGTTSKTAFAGWFSSQPNFLSILREQAIANREVTVIKSGPLVFGSKRGSARDMVY
jgi:hypothetical protein